MFELDCTVASLQDNNYPPRMELEKGSHAVVPGLSHWFALVPVSSPPDWIPNSPNLRPARVNTPVAKVIYGSLVSNDGDFHLKNKGITLLATAVEQHGGVTRVTLDTAAGQNGDGILDGGHTYAIIQKAKQDGKDLSRQFVFLWIRVQVPVGIRAAIAEGLNKSAAVSEGSLANRRGEFDWLKALLPASSLEHISWTQNESRAVKIEELIAQLYAINASPGVAHVAAYSTRAKSLGVYRKTPEVFTSHAPIVCDALRLYEFITIQLAPSLDTSLGARAVERKARGTYPVLFDPNLAPQNRRVTRGVALPIFGAMRAFLREDIDGNFNFDRPYSEILDVLGTTWMTSLLKLVGHLWEDPAVAGDPGAFGKRESTWKELYFAMSKVATENPPKSSRQRSALPKFQPAVFVPERVLSDEDILEQWREELLDARARLAQLEEMKAENQVGKHQDFHVQEQATRKEIAQFERAIEYGEEVGLGACSTCGESVSEERLVNATWALTCGQH